MKNITEVDELDRMLPFSFDLPRDRLIYIDNSADLDMLAAEFADCVMMGIDTERKPSFQKGKPINPTSIIQLATRSSTGSENVFIVDLLAMKHNFGYMERLDSILTKIMLDENCFKIGQGLRQDFCEMHASYPSMAAFQKANGVIETAILQKKIDAETVQMISLKNLVKMYLHLNLIKTQQLSNWGLRPLNDNQLHYAACDALVLLRLVDAMNCELEERLAEQCVPDSAEPKKFSLKDIAIAIDVSQVSGKELVKVKAPSRHRKSMNIQHNGGAPGTLSPLMKTATKTLFTVTIEHEEENTNNNNDGKGNETKGISISTATKEKRGIAQKNKKNANSNIEEGPPYAKRKLDHIDAKLL